LQAVESSKEGVSSFSCTLQGWSIQFFTLSTITLTTCISANLYFWVVRSKSLRTLQKYEYKYLAMAFGPTLLLSLLLLIPVGRSAPTTQDAEQEEASAFDPKPARTSYGPAVSAAVLLRPVS
jgi:hypothetical protein